MSRIGKKPVEVPSGVNISVSGGQVTVEKGDKRLSYAHRPEVRVSWNESERQVVCEVDSSRANTGQMRAYWGLTRALIQNMVDGVTKGYEKRLEVVGVGWNASVAGAKLMLKVGFANTVEIPIPAGLEVSVERAIITIKGVDKQLVGQFAAVVRSKRKPEPYNGKGIKYLDETIRRKQGKVFGS